MKGFMKFVREQGVAGIAVGFILGGAISVWVTSLVNGIINPIIAALVDTSSLGANTVTVGGAVLEWGALLEVTINFLILAAVVYWGVKALKLDSKK
jgi:large conductance mechanosensitive channel